MTEGCEQQSSHSLTHSPCEGSRCSACAYAALAALSWRWRARTACTAASAASPPGFAERSALSSGTGVTPGASSVTYGVVKCDIHDKEV
jgi:hypothetical protein